MIDAEELVGTVFSGLSAPVIEDVEDAGKVIVVRAAQDLSAESVKEVKAYIEAPADEVIMVLVHAGGTVSPALRWLKTKSFTSVSDASVR